VRPTGAPAHAPDQEALAAPGGIATGMSGTVAGLPAGKAALAALQPIPRAGLPDDVAQAAAFLAHAGVTGPLGTAGR